MKILLVNKFYYIGGGSETYYFSLKNLLEKNGHEVIDFSMKDDRNLKSNYSDFFVENIDYNKEINIIKKIKYAFKFIYSIEAKRKFKKLIKKTKPDIIHLNIFQHQISSSIVNVAVKMKIPIIYTAHDLKALCPNYKMLNNNRICEKCKNSKFLNCTKNKCIKDSRMKSLLGTLEAEYNHINKTYEKFNYIITPSKFYMDKFIEFGFNKNKIIYIPNFLEDSNINYKNNSEQNYFLYFGRFSREKGILTLIKATQIVGCNLKIVGTGLYKNEIIKYIKDNNIKNVELLGFLTGENLYNIIGNSKAVVIPSEWYENGPYSAIEALRMSKPIIGSNLGGIPELINKNGFIFNARDVEDLASKINLVDNMSEYELKKLGENSYKIFKEKYVADNYYKNIIKIYNDLIKS